MIKAEPKYGKVEYRLAKIERTLPDTCGRVQTVVVSNRNRRQARGEGPEQARAGRVETEIAIQRLVVILTWEEIWKDGLMAAPNPPISENQQEKGQISRSGGGYVKKPKRVNK